MAAYLCTINLAWQRNTPMTIYLPLFDLYLLILWVLFWNQFFIDVFTKPRNGTILYNISFNNGRLQWLILYIVYIGPNRRSFAPKTEILLLICLTVVAYHYYESIVYLFKNTIMMDTNNYYWENLLIFGFVLKHTF